MWLIRQNANMWRRTKEWGEMSGGLFWLGLVLLAQLLIQFGPAAPHPQVAVSLVGAGSLLLVLITISLFVDEYHNRGPYATAGDWACGFTVHCPHCDNIQPRLGARFTLGKLPHQRHNCTHCKGVFRT